ncbi:hypothetical protein PoB_002575400 [Plakobranchus ocellatus]|uniref:Uncharacterized protein n=1 Tax=Plakobranchus ocellatus TaxID=259542 RepID=A0AAV3ZZ81_9GAST|nr:hypothetical protein PoB_002575400 [Plakobranchus ocellatus]
MHGTRVVVWSVRGRGKPLDSLRVCGCGELLVSSFLALEGRRLYGRPSVCSFGRTYIAIACAVFNHCYGTCTVGLWRAVWHSAPSQIVIVIVIVVIGVDRHHRRSSSSSL